MDFKGKHEIQDHLEKTIYHVEGQLCDRLSVFRISPAAEEGKVKLYTKTCYFSLEATLKGVLRTREANKMSTVLTIASWQFPKMGFQRLKLLLTDPEPESEGDAIHVQCVQAIEKPDYWLKPYGDG